MPKNNALARTSKKQDEIMVVEKKEQIELLKQTYAKGASDVEFKMLFAVANKVGADPFRKEIYLIPFWDNEAKRMGRTPVVGIDWYRKQAGKSPNYAGQGEAEFGEDVNSNGTTHPAWAVVPIFNHKFTQPVRVKVFWNEVAKIGKDGYALSNWKSMPHTMLAKCSEAQGIRKAFPEEVAGVYIEEEMNDNVIINSEIQAPKTNIQAEVKPVKVDDGKVEYLKQLLQCAGKTEEDFLGYLKKDKLEDIDEVSIDNWIKKLEDQIKANEEKNVVPVEAEVVEEPKDQAQQIINTFGGKVVSETPAEPVIEDMPKTETPAKPKSAAQLKMDELIKQRKAEREANKTKD